MKVDYLAHMGNDLMVANCARVSFNKYKDELDDKDEKLITYLAKHKHRSPFYHPKLQLRIHCPFFVANQLKRHQVGFDINEVSRRYVDDTPEFYTPEVMRGRPDKSIKQGSGDTEIVQLSDGTKATDAYAELMGFLSHIYGVLLEEGIAPEQARMVLPQATYTTWIWTGSLYGWANLLNQRLDSHAQKECRDVAEMIKVEVEKIFPISLPALLEYMW